MISPAAGPPKASNIQNGPDGGKDITPIVFSATSPQRTKRIPILSDDNARLVIVLSELGRAAPLLFTEDAVEVAQIVETTTVANLGDGVCAVNKLSAGIS